MKTIGSMICCVILLSAYTCNNKSNESSTTNSITKKLPTDSSSVTIPDYYNEETVNDTLALNIKDYLNTTLLKPEDARAITSRDKKFQIYQIDLNNDGKNEIFVNLFTPYFCGSGGCTVLLLSSELNPITTFTVTHPPIFAEKATINGWRTLMVKSKEEWKSLEFNNKTYPANPTIVKKSAFDAPSGNAEIIFSQDEELKTYEF